MKKISIRLNGETYFGIDITSDGRLVVAERVGGRPAQLKHFEAGEHASVRSHIEREGAHPQVCIKACGAAALALAGALVPVPGIGVTLVAPRAIQEASAALTAEERAVQLARLAERLF